jgi:hypothetical protein
MARCSFFRSSSWTTAAATGLCSNEQGSAGRVAMIDDDDGEADMVKCESGWCCWVSKRVGGVGWDGNSEVEREAVVMNTAFDAVQPADTRARGRVLPAGVAKRGRAGKSRGSTDLLFRSCPDHPGSPPDLDIPEPSTLPRSVGCLDCIFHR